MNQGMTLLDWLLLLSIIVVAVWVAGRLFVWLKGNPFPPMGVIILRKRDLFNRRGAKRHLAERMFLFSGVSRFCDFKRDRHQGMWRVTHPDVYRHEADWFDKMVAIHIHVPEPQYAPPRCCRP